MKPIMSGLTALVVALPLNLAAVSAQADGAALAHPTRAIASRVARAVAHGMTSETRVAASATGSLAAPAREHRVKCQPSETVLCDRQGSRKSDARSVVTTTDAPGTSTAFDLAPVSHLIPGAGQRNRFNANFERELDTLKPRLPKPHGRALAVRAAAKNPQVSNLLNASGSAHRGRDFQKRAFREGFSVDACPRPDVKSSPGFGSFHINGAAYYEVQSAVQRGSRVDYTDVEFKMEFSASSFLRGSTDSEADVVGLLQVGTGLDLELPIQVTRQDVIDNLKTGKRTYLPAAHFQYTLEYFFEDRMIIRGGGGFDAFIAKNMNDDASEGDTDATPRLFGDAVDQMVKSFANMVGARVNPAIDAAEKYWKTPGNCVTLRLQGPFSLTPGQDTDVYGTVSSAIGVSERDILGSDFPPDIDAIRLAATVDRPDGSVRIIALTPLQPGEPWFKYTAPGSAWSDSEHPGFHVRFWSTAGIAEAKISFKTVHGILIKGTIDWTESVNYDCPGCSGGDHRTGTFMLDMVAPVPSAAGWTNDGGGYQVTDKLDETDNEGGGTPCTTTASKNAAGPWVSAATAGKGHAYLDWAFTHWVGIGIAVDGTEEVKVVCGSNTSTTDAGIDWEPGCETKGQPYLPDALAGKFEGKDFNGTITVKCSGTESGYVHYDIHGTLKVSNHTHSSG